MADEVSSVPRENIVLVGFMGSGKSSIGRLLAKRLGFQFLDTDHLIIERAGMPISETPANRPPKPGSANAKPTEPGARSRAEAKGSSR